MKKIFFLLIGVILFLPAFSQTITVDNARTIATNYLLVNESRRHFDTLRHVTTLYGDKGTAVVHVFDIDSTGYILASALQRFTPVVGYSFKGRWDVALLPHNFLSWLNSYIEDVEAVRSSDSLPQTILNEQAEWENEYKALINGDSRYYSRKNAKNVNALIQTYWSQGEGYNNYCPVYSNAMYSNNGHAVTGCVATAMAQIIRYYQYPSYGFGEKSYRHYYYGNLSAKFDTTFYNYSLMPVMVNGYSADAEQDAVSTLCYHCGVAVKMEYENPNHTTGSGAASNEVPNGLKHFGYFASFYYGKNAHNNIWDSLLRNDLENGHPVYYSGSSSEGGHAFICDGYRSYQSKYHFNFGWGYGSDGWYTTSHVNGYSTNQAAVFNIVPSNIGPYREKYYFSSNATGDGTSWNSPTSDITNIYNVFDIYNGGVLWMKEGTYYGDVSSDTAFTLHKGLTIYGGFNGTENSLSERDLTSSPTILSGQGVRKLLSVPSGISAIINDITFADGYAEEGSVVTLDGNVKLERCTFVGNRCQQPDGAALSTSSSMVLNCKFYNNHCGAAIIDGIPIKNSLIAHNDGFGIVSNSGTVDGCDIVCNNGTGVINNGTTKIRNSVLWRNDSSLANTNITRITFCAIEGFGERDSNSNFGISHINRPDNGIGPFFIMPDTTKGPIEFVDDWHLSSLSPLVDAGDTLHAGSYAYDLDNGGRFRNGRADIGCYEWIPGNAIPEVEKHSYINVYPNPASEHITVENAAGRVLIYDMMGRCIYQTNTSDKKITLDISAFPRGLYILRTDNASSRFIKR